MLLSIVFTLRENLATLSFINFYSELTLLLDVLTLYEILYKVIKLLVRIRIEYTELHLTTIFIVGY